MQPKGNNGRPWNTRQVRQCSKTASTVHMLYCQLQIKLNVPPAVKGLKSITSTEFKGKVSRFWKMSLTTEISPLPISEYCQRYKTWQIIILHILLNLFTTSYFTLKSVNSQRWASLTFLRLKKHNFYQELLKEKSNPRLKGNRKGIIVKGIK